MAYVTIKQGSRLVLHNEIKQLSSLGFDCEIPLAEVANLRDEAGRIQTFDFELVFKENQEPLVKGSITIYSVRRVTQSQGMLTARFIKLEPELVRLIVEYIDTGKVVDMKSAQQKRRA